MHEAIDVGFARCLHITGVFVDTIFYKAVGYMKITMWWNHLNCHSVYIGLEFNTMHVIDVLL